MQNMMVVDHREQAVIDKAVDCLQQGGLVIFPTETTYGAGVDATNQEAVDKLLAYKSRREGKPLSIAVTNHTMAEQYVELNDQAKKLYQQFLPGPVTVVSKSMGKVAAGVESEFGTLGVRIPDYGLILKIVEALGKPLTATSANASGGARPYSIDQLLVGLSTKQKDLIDLVLDAGELPHNPPSTVIDTTLSSPVTMRQGNVYTNQKVSDTTQLNSTSEAETQTIAGKLMLKHWNELTNYGLVIGLDGELGAGKTVFAQGVAKFLQIDEQITSPTYSYMEEYNFSRHGFKGKLHHLDLWKVDSPEELDRLEINQLLMPGSVMLIEWWSQVADWIKPLLVATNIPLINVSIFETENSSEKNRKIVIAN